MGFILFVIVYPIVWIISRLPMRLLYIISDILFFFVYYVFGYRKKVVFNNIKMSFPEKTEKEIKTITKKFFNHFTDLIIESIKSFTISEKELNKRYTYKNVDLLKHYASNSNGIILTAAHLANWEWMFYLPSMVDIPMYAAFTKLGNKHFDKLIRDSRSRFGGGGFKDEKIIRALHKNNKQKAKGLYFLLSDQSPQLSKSQYWRNFLEIKVPVHTGLESMAKKFDLTIIHCVTKKVKRGYYEAEFKLITDNPKTYNDFEITDKYFELVNKSIREQPHNYLWSHKRFKHKDKYDKWLAIQANKNKKTAS